MDEKKHPTQSQGKNENHKDGQQPQSGLGRPATAKRVMSKRWLYPAIYLGAAALIIGLMYVKSQSGTSPVVATPNGDGGSTTTSANPAETWAWPVASGTQTKLGMGFYPENGTKAQQAAAIVEYDNTYYPHVGLDIQSASGAAFNVTASLSGKVTAVTDSAPGNALYGNSVEVTSPNGYVERYESLGTVSVKVGEEVNQGQVLGTAGKNLFEASQGVHVFFEVLQNGQPVDPQHLLPKQ